MYTKSHLLEGIVLRSTSYQDSDKLITLFTKEKGKVVCIAKGIKKLTSRKRPSLEVFTHVRFQATNTHLGIITEVQTLDSFVDLRTDLKNVAVAYFLCEAVNKSVADDSPHPAIFDLLLNSFVQLEEKAPRKSIKDVFLLTLLEELGYINADTKISDPLKVFEEIVERKLGSARIGKMLQ